MAFLVSTMAQGKNGKPPGFYSGAGKPDDDSEEDSFDDRSSGKHDGETVHSYEEGKGKGMKILPANEIIKLHHTVYGLQHKIDRMQSSLDSLQDSFQELVKNIPSKATLPGSPPKHSDGYAQRLEIELKNTHTEMEKLRMEFAKAKVELDERKFKEQQTREKQRQGGLETIRKRQERGDFVPRDPKKARMSSSSSIASRALPPGLALSVLGPMPQNTPIQPPAMLRLSPRRFASPGSISELLVAPPTIQRMKEEDKDKDKDSKDGK